jgi:hypothetical protein
MRHRLFVAWALMTIAATAAFGEGKRLQQRIEAPAEGSVDEAMISAYLSGEARKILQASVSLKNRASRLRLEGDRLSTPTTNPGHPRSTNPSETADAFRLRSIKLDEESSRLALLAAAIDPQAQKDLVDRMRACCAMGSSLMGVRAEIIKIAREMGTDYVPDPLGQ